MNFTQYLFDSHNKDELKDPSELIWIPEFTYSLPFLTSIVIVSFTVELLMAQFE